MVNVEIGKIIKKRRKRLNLSADKLGERIGKDRSTIYRYERGDIENLSVEVLGSLADALQLSIPELLGLEDVKPLPSFREYRYLTDVTLEALAEQKTIPIPDEILGEHANDINIFFMHVNTDSMNKILPRYSLMAVKCCSLCDLKDGDIVVYSYGEGEDYSVKKFYRLKDKLLFRPYSTDITILETVSDINDEELKVYGKVVTYIINK